VIKRGAGGSFFRSLYADFLREAEELLPGLGASGLAPRMDAIAARWREFSDVLKEQSERETCDAGLFLRAGSMLAELASEEESFFRTLQTAAED